MNAVGAPICFRKRRYPRFSDAIRARDELIKDSTLEAYWCGEHHAYHLGHDRVGNA